MAPDTLSTMPRRLDRGIRVRAPGSFVATRLGVDCVQPGGLLQRLLLADKLFGTGDGMARLRLGYGPVWLPMSGMHVQDDVSHAHTMARSPCGPKLNRPGLYAAPYILTH